jgi:hypothetical protein
MVIPLRHTAISLFVAIAACAVPAFAQNAAPAPAAPAAAATTNYGTKAPTPADRQLARRNSEADLLGAPNPYGTADAVKGNTVDTQQAALLDEQRMRVTGGGPGALTAQGKGNKAPAAANGQVRVAGQAGRANAADGLMPATAAKNTYADPYDTSGPGKHAVYRSPW